MRRLFRKAGRLGRVFLPPRLMASLENKLLVTLWSVAAVTTLSVALAQGLRMFLLSFLAVLFGTLAALWMLAEMARR